MLKNGNSGNRNGKQNQKTEFFLVQKTKNLKNGQNCKTENSNAPLLNTCACHVLEFLDLTKK